MTGSQGLPGLQRKLGAPLLFRACRRITLAPFGEGFRAEVGAAYGQLAEVPERSHEAGRGLAERCAHIHRCGTGYHVRAMSTAMSSARLGASAASRVSQASVTGSWLTLLRVRARRAIPVLMSAAGFSRSPSVYRTRVLCRGTCRRVAW